MPRDFEDVTAMPTQSMKILFSIFKHFHIAKGAPNVMEMTSLDTRIFIDTVVDRLQRSITYTVDMSPALVLRECVDKEISDITKIAEYEFMLQLVRELLTEICGIFPQMLMWTETYVEYIDDNELKFRGR